MSGGVYVHFPYCRHHCAYCDFAVATPRRVPARAYTDAVLAELRQRAPLLGGPAATLYFGGGTPSLWPLDELGRVIEAVRAAPGLEEGAEVTLEANPAEVGEGWLGAVRRLGVTRISLGVQSLRDPLLRAADRRHDATTARAAVAAVAAAGFESWSLDLIFGLAGQQLRGWVEDLEALATQRPPHLSVYALTVEPRTRLAWQLRRGDVALPGDAAQTAMLFAARSVLRAAGWRHYEVSSYARPGHRSRHNGAYWAMTPFLGLGAGAHGFVAPRRWWNARRPRRYIEGALAGDPTAGAEELTPETLAFERLMTGLRDLERGVAEGPDLRRFGAAIERELTRGRLERLGPRLRLTEEGLRMMNDVLLELLPGPA